MAIVVDASVAVAWSLPRETGGARADAVAMQLVGEQGIVPGIFWYEIRNVLIRAERRGRIESDRTAHFLGRLGELVESDHDHDETTTLRLAREYRLSVYDAAYLETALRREAALATFDNDLAAAARAEGVTNPAEDHPSEDP